MVRIYLQRILILFFVILLAAPVDLAAQRVSDLSLGARVRVETNGSGFVTGTFESATTDSIKIRTHLDRRAFALDSTRSVLVSSGPGRTRGMLRVGIPAGIIGGAVGAAISGLAWEHCRPGHIYDCRFAPTTRARATVSGGAIIGLASMLIGGVAGAISGSEGWAPVTTH